MSWRNNFLISVFIVLIYLIISNPSEIRYLDKISDEYGRVHHGMKFSAPRLKQIGSGDRLNLILCSRYSYTFGNVTLNYLGLGGLIIKVNNDFEELHIESPEEKKGIAA